MRGSTSPRSTELIRLSSHPSHPPCTARAGRCRLGGAATPSAGRPSCSWWRRWPPPRALCWTQCTRHWTGCGGLGLVEGWWQWMVFVKPAAVPVLQVHGQGSARAAGGDAAAARGLARAASALCAHWRPPWPVRQGAAAAATRGGEGKGAQARGGVKGGPLNCKNGGRRPEGAGRAARERVSAAGRKNARDGLVRS